MGAKDSGRQDGEGCWARKYLKSSDTEGMYLTIVLLKLYRTIPAVLFSLVSLIAFDGPPIALVVSGGINVKRRHPAVPVHLE